MIEKFASRKDIRLGFIGLLHDVSENEAMGFIQLSGPSNWCNVRGSWVIHIWHMALWLFCTF